MNREYWVENYFRDYDGSMIPDRCETLTTVTVGQIKELLDEIDELREFKYMYEELCK